MLSSPIVRVLLGLFALVGVCIGGAFAVRAQRQKNPPPAAVKVVPDDFSPPPIRALPSNEEQAQAWLRMPETWPIEPLVREDLYGMRVMWLNGFKHACDTRDEALKKTYVRMLGKSRDWVAQDIGCREALNAAAESPDAAHAYVIALYAAGPKGAWFEAVRGPDTITLRAFANGKRYSVQARGPDDYAAAAVLLNTLYGTQRCSPAGAGVRCS